MNIEELKAYKAKLSQLNELEEKERNKYLRKIATGEIQGPMTGYPSIDKPWLNRYDEKALEAKNKANTMYQTINMVAKEHPDVLAIEYYGKKYSFSDMMKKVDNLADIFVNKYNIKSGDVVTMLLPNIPENVFITYALNKIGAIANIIDLRSKSDVLVHLVNSVDSKMIFTTDLFVDNYLEVKDQLCTKNVVVNSVTDSMSLVVKGLYYTKAKKLKKSEDYLTWSEFEKQATNKNEVEVYDNQDACACILYTSGTTGFPKGVQLSNKAINSISTEYANANFDFEVGDRIFNHILPFLAYDIVANIHLPFSLGVSVVMLPVLNYENFAKDIYKLKINHVVTGPGDWSAFTKSDFAKKHNYDKLKTLACGSDRLNENIKEYVKNKTGKDIVEGYGCTEGSTAICTNLYNGIKPLSVGVPLPLNNMSVFDGCNELCTGETGEICFTGPSEMIGYYNNDTETNKMKMLHDDGKVWIHTGDLGHFDKDGFLFVDGRLKRIIVMYDGQKVSPFEIEQCVLKCDIVNNCCVIGGNDLVHGNGKNPVAVVKLNCQLNIDNAKQIIYDWCVNHLTAKQIPFDIEIVDDLKLTDVGKIDFRSIESDYNESKEKILSR